MALDIITYILSKKYTDKVVESLPAGFVYKGSLPYKKDLPTSASVGWIYTILYTGESGMNPWGAEFVCDKVEGGVANWVQRNSNAVIDVKVNNTSIVTNGIANIDLSSPAFKENFDKALDESGKIKQINDEIDTINTEITELQTNLDTVAEAVITVKGRVDVLEPKVTTLEDKVAVLEPKVSDLEPRVAKIETDVDQAEKDIAAIQTWISKVKLDGGEIKASYTLTGTLTNVIADSSNPGTVAYKGNAALVFTAATSYVLPANITVNGIPVGADLVDCGYCDAKWTKATGKLEISNAINDITFIITGVAEA